MPTKTKKKQDSDAVLAEAMLRDLEALKQQGPGAYPPKLAELARLSGRVPTDEQVQKAANKKAFTANAVVIEKVDKKPSLVSPVYIKGDEPSPEERLAERMVSVLESQRRLGSDAYPPLLRRLAELCNLRASDTLVTKAADHAVFREKGIVAARAGKKPSLDAPIVLKEDLARSVAVILCPLVRFCLAPETKPKKGEPRETTAFPLGKAVKRVVPELQKIVSDALDPEAASSDLPGDVAWVMSEGNPLFFLREYARPGPLKQAHAEDGHVSPPCAIVEEHRGSDKSVTQAFREAFEELNRRNGWTNLVKLFELREALSSFGRSEFDSGLRGLRLAGEFSLESHEGRHESLTLEEREAGIHEAGSLLVYASRR